MRNEPDLKPAEKIAACAAALWPILFVAVLAAVAGCMRSITITRHADSLVPAPAPDVAAASEADPALGPDATRSVACKVLSGGWRLDYLALGLKTDVSSIKARRTSDGKISVEIDGVATDVSARHAEIIESAGTAAGNAAKAAAALK